MFALITEKSERLEMNVMVKNMHTVEGLEEEANQGQGQGQEQETGVRAAVSGQHHSQYPCSGGREPAQL